MEHRKTCPVFTRAQACSAGHTTTVIGTAGVLRSPCRRYVFSAAERVKPARCLSHRHQTRRRPVGLSMGKPWASADIGEIASACKRGNGPAEFTKPICRASIWEGPWVRDRQRYAFPVGRCSAAAGMAGGCSEAGGPRRCQRGDVPITSTNARAIEPRRPSAPMTAAVTSYSPAGTLSILIVLTTGAWSPSSCTRLNR